MTTLVNRNIKISTHTLTWSVTQLMRDYIKIGKISTHTLTWSVTEDTACLVSFITISTHTLTWSVTYRGIAFFRYNRFQLTRSRGA